MFYPDEKGLAVERIMDENVPGWRDRKDDFETFDAYSDWISMCVQGILIHGSDRKDH